MKEFVAMLCIVKIMCFITARCICKTVCNVFDYVCVIFCSFSTNYSSSPFLITEKDRISQMQEHYERLLQKAKDQQEVLREEIDMTRQDLTRTQNWYVAA